MGFWFANKNTHTVRTSNNSRYANIARMLPFKKKGVFRDSQTGRAPHRKIKNGLLISKVDQLEPADLSLIHISEPTRPY